MFFCTFASVNLRSMAKKKILFINQEISPYVPDTSLSVLGRELPKAMQERDHEIRTFMPKWGTINERRGQLHEVIRLSGMNLIINDTDHPLIIKVASIVGTRVQVYFIDNDDYFSKRQMTTDEHGVDYSDNGERAIFFARGVLETVKKLRWVPDIIHCQGWMSAVIPFYIDLGTDFKQSLEYRDAKPELLSAYNDSFDFDALGKLAIDYSDGIMIAQEEVNPVLTDYAKTKEVPILPFAENWADGLDEFYDKIYPDK